MNETKAVEKPVDLPATCGECQHASWQRTPSGRIKRMSAGYCTKEKELRAMYTTKSRPPCLVMGVITVNGIWPDYDASGCPVRTLKQPGEK